MVRERALTVKARMMSERMGVYAARKKDNSIYYRASLTHRGKHISLGSYAREEAAAEAYLLATSLLGGEPFMPPLISDYEKCGTAVTFAKWVMLINLRDNGLYCNGPIYLKNRYFEYFLDQTCVLKFGADELFFYTHHTIQKRGGHLFFADFGMQTSVLSRYGVRSHAVKGRDYLFKNGDELDFTPGNIVIVNQYHGVRKETVHGKTRYCARIHVNGDLVIGRYDTEREAAIAYNKAVDVLGRAGVTTSYEKNYIEDMSEAEYRIRYGSIRLSGRFMKHADNDL